MSESTSAEQKIPKGSYAAGRRVVIPGGAKPPIIVFVNGIAQTEGTDYTLRGNEVNFTRDIIKESKSGKKKMVMMLGLFGFYHKNETIDIQYQLDGRTQLASDLPVLK